MKSPKHQKGTAILTAMITVTVVGTIAAAALSAQWRNVEVEKANRSQAQATLLLSGALEWSKLLLRQDAQSSQVDHLAEPWAMPLSETKVTSFISANNGVQNIEDASADMDSAFMTGNINDAQAKINLQNLAYDSTGGLLLGLKDIFSQKGIDPAEAEKIQKGFQESISEQPSDSSGLLAQTLQDLAWYGVQSSTIEALSPFATIINAQTKVNINTASIEAILFADPSLDADQVNRLISERKGRHFRHLGDVAERLSVKLDENRFTTSSQFFDAKGAVRIDNITVNTVGRLKRVEKIVETVEISG